MFKVLGIVALVLIGAYLAMVFWLSQSGFMSEGGGFGAAAGVENLTGRELTLEALVDGDEWTPLPGLVSANRYERWTISAAGWYGEGDLIGRDGCTYVPLRAVDTEGHVVARHPQPLCDGETWVIKLTNEPTSSERSSEPSPTLRVGLASPRPSNDSYEDEAAAAIRELTGSDCQVAGTGDFGSIDVTAYADAIAELPDRTGWLDEPFLWVGSVEGLVAAREATLVGQATRGTWIVFTDDAGEPRAESYWAFPNAAGDVIWFLKDSVAAGPCPSDG